VPGGSPRVTRLFQRLFALVSLLAWLSLASQVSLLVGSRGLVPMKEWLNGANETPFWDAPTLFWLGTGDSVIVAGTWVGAAVSIVALFGFAPRVMFALSTILYLSYAVACRSFLAFQWDNLLLECGLLSLFLSGNRRAPLAHLAFRVLLFKLYFESGVAKSASPLGDWWDGSAMSYYYETAPIPTALARPMHHLPAFWHSLESRLTLFLELVVPFAIFKSRKLRLWAFALLTGFQVVNLLTANYGFFVYLALVLHVFLLDGEDITRVLRWVDRKLAKLPRPALLVTLSRFRRRIRITRPRLACPRWLAWAGFAVYAGISLAQALRTFTPPLRENQLVGEIADLGSSFRVVNTYHLFAEITRERIEPEFQTSDGQGFIAHDLRYKPGALDRAPPFIAPHQPRVDFLLWFYGLDHRAAPDYVYGLLLRMCKDPESVQPLFAEKLPEHPTAVRVAFHEYHFSDRGEPGYWRRRELGATRSLTCGLR
jgi:lipase maturation factor 1